MSEDTNWYRIHFDNNLHLDQYYGTSLHNNMIKDDFYYLLEMCNGQTHIPTLSEGYFLHKIDLNTGKPKWVHYDNFYSGNEYVETVFGGNMYFDQEENIVVNGFKSLDSIKNIHFDGFDNRVYVNVMQDIINDQNGYLLDHRVDLDTSRTIDKLHPGGFGLRKVGNRRQVKHMFENVFEDSLVRNYLHFYDIDEGGIVSDAPIFSYKHTTSIDFNAPFLSFPNIYHQITENKGVALFGSRDQAQGNIPVDLKLIFFDTSNSPNIIVTEERSILNLLPQDLHKSTGYPTIRSKNGYFYIGQKARISIDSMTQELYIWLQLYDDAGNLIQKVDRLQIDGYDIDLISDYTIIDSTLYLLGRRFDSSPIGEDLYYFIKANENSNLEVLSTFVKPLAFNDHTVGFSGMTILDNYDVLFYLNVNYPFMSDPIIKANASFLCRYDGKDLGLSTSVTNEILKKTTILSPNPGKDYIKLNGKIDQKISNLIIVDISGNSFTVDIYDGNIIDISDLVPGSYFVKYYQNDKQQSIPFVKI